MSGQDIKLRILSDLKIISEIRSGYTLSPTTMSIIDHNSWSTSFWRSYSGETRKNTIATIKTIFNDAIRLLEIDPTQELILAIDEGLRGFGNLRDTYREDYLLIAELNRITDDISRRIKDIGDKMANEVIAEVEITNEKSEDINNAIMSSDSDQKISPIENSEKDHSTSSSDMGEMVPSSDRDISSNAVEEILDCSSGINDAEDRSSISDIDHVCLKQTTIIKSKSLSDYEQKQKIGSSEIDFIKSESLSDYEEEEETLSSHVDFIKSELSSDYEEEEETLSSHIDFIKSELSSDYEEEEETPSSHVDFIKKINRGNYDYFPIVSSSYESTIRTILECCKSEFDIEAQSWISQTDSSIRVHIKPFSNKHRNPNEPPILKLALAFKKWIRGSLSEHNGLSEYEYMAMET
jgi:hypothetical protein